MDEKYPKSSPPTKFQLKSPSLQNITEPSRTKSVKFDATKNTTKKFSIVSLLSFSSKSSKSSSNQKLKTPNLGAIIEEEESEKTKWGRSKKMIVQCVLLKVTHKCLLFIQP